MTTHPIIDLRSDTVTQPTPAMRRAMAAAEVGDDVYGEDPTVNRLQERFAAMMGKEAALFVASGTMGNFTSVLAHCGRGDEVILGNQSHIHLAEQGGIAALGGVYPHIIPNQADGTLDFQQILAAIRPADPHCPVTRLLAIENTQNRCSGRVLPVAYMDAIGTLAHQHGLKLHVDGARLWNAAVSLGVPPARLVAQADSVTCCLSKGLGAPVGSLVAGDAEFIGKAHRVRKVLGGSLRQAGILAAAGLVALDEMIERLTEDHANAKLLAHGLAQLEGIDIDPAAIETNIVYFTVTHETIKANQLVSGLADQGVRLNGSSSNRLRAVSHYHITSSDVERTLDAFETVLRNGANDKNRKQVLYG